jgi:ABC-type amino acid transport system permease subunit
MNDLLNFLPAGFIPDLLNGMKVNFQIASVILILGLLIGGLLTGVSLMGGVLGIIVTFFVGLIRAMPTFLAMICLLYLIPKQIVIAGSSFALSGVVLVILSLVPYAVAYVFDNFSESIRQWRRGQMITALQLLPNLSRLYFILIMSSSAGAAIGVTEGVTTLLRYASRSESIQERLLLYAIGILFFGIVMQTAFALINRLRTVMIARVSRRAES